MIRDAPFFPRELKKSHVLHSVINVKLHMSFVTVMFQLGSALFFIADKINEM